MADINRKAVSYLVLHHAVTPLWSEKSKAQLAQWFSDNGFKQAYGSNPSNWSGLINPYTKARSYSQAHYAGQRVDSKTPDATAAEKAAGYRLVPLVEDVYGQITWHAGNWDINTRSIGIENLGDYRNYTLRDSDAKVIADFWRPQDKKMSGNTVIVGHQEVSDLGTACPARVMEMRDKIVDYVNNPPAVVKPPVITTKETVKKEKIAYTTSTVEDDRLPKGERRIIQSGIDGERATTYTTTYSDGKATSESAKSVVTKEPVSEIIAIGTYVEPAKPQLPEPEDSEDVTSWLSKLVKAVIALLKSFTYKK